MVSIYIYNILVRPMNLYIIIIIAFGELRRGLDRGRNSI
jgi:hypothetical protein